MRTIEGKPVFQVAFGMVWVPGGNYWKKAKKNHRNLILSLQTHGWFSFFNIYGNKRPSSQKEEQSSKMDQSMRIGLSKAYPAVESVSFHGNDCHSNWLLHGFSLLLFYLFYSFLYDGHWIIKYFSVCFYKTVSKKRLSYSDILMFYIITTTQRVATILMFDFRFSGFWPLSFNVFIKFYIISWTLYVIMLTLTMNNNGQKSRTPCARMSS